MQKLAVKIMSKTKGMIIATMSMIREGIEGLRVSSVIVEETSLTNPRDLR